MLTFIWAEDLENNIGYKGKIPWHLPADMHNFKEVTMGHPMIMGRKTFESLPGILPGRLNIVLTHDQTLIDKYADVTGVRFFSNKADLLKWVDEHQKEKVTVIGGRSVFKMLLPQVHELNRTVINGRFKADTKMININYEDFELKEKAFYYKNVENAFSFINYIYIRKTM